MGKRAQAKILPILLPTSVTTTRASSVTMPVESHPSLTANIVPKAPMLPNVQIHQSLGSAQPIQMLSLPMLDNGKIINEQLLPITTLNSQMNNQNQKPLISIAPTNSIGIKLVTSDQLKNQNLPLANTSGQLSNEAFLRLINSGQISNENILALLGGSEQAALAPVTSIPQVTSIPVSLSSVRSNSVVSQAGGNHPYLLPTTGKKILPRTFQTNMMPVPVSNVQNINLIQTPLTTSFPQITTAYQPIMLSNPTQNTPPTVSTTNSQPHCLPTLTFQLPLMFPSSNQAANTSKSLEQLPNSQQNPDYSYNEERIRLLENELRETRVLLNKEKSRAEYQQKRLDRIINCPTPPSDIEKALEEAFTKSYLLKELVISQYRRHRSEKERRKLYTNIELELSDLFYEATGYSERRFRILKRIGLIFPARPSRTRQKHRVRLLEASKSTQSLAESKIAVEKDVESTTSQPLPKNQKIPSTVPSLREEQQYRPIVKQYGPSKKTMLGVHSRSIGKRTIPLEPMFIRTRTGSGWRYSCLDCPLSTTSFTSIVEHCKTHPLPSKARTYKCPVLNCEYSTTKIALLRHHSYKHVTKYSLSCKMCDKTFKRPYDLSQHKILHIEEDRFAMFFECEARGCKFKTMSPNKLEEHRKSCNRTQNPDPVVEVLVEANRVEGEAEEENTKPVLDDPCMDPLAISEDLGKEDQPQPSPFDQSETEKNNFETVLVTSESNMEFKVEFEDEQYLQ